LALWAFAASAGFACFAATPVAASVDRHDLFSGETGILEGAWESNSNGGAPKFLAEAPEPEALSPNGRVLAYVQGGGIKLHDIGGGAPITVYTPSCSSPCAEDHARMPQFSPDGTKLIFAEFEWYHGFKEGVPWLLLKSSIHAISTDGTGLTTILAEGAGHSASPDYSPDMTKVVYAKYKSGESGAEEIVVANADGTGPSVITSEAIDADEPRFSPDGTKIAFDGTTPESDWDIYTVKTDGTGLKQITKEEHLYEEFAFRPEWNTDGSRVVYEYGSEYGTPKYELYSVKSDGTGGEEPFVSSSGGLTSSWAGVFSPVGSTTNVKDDEYLGLNFEPLLQFHSTEKWRPLNVDQFMREEDPENLGHSYNKLCSELGGCEDIPAEWRSALAGKEWVATGKLSGKEYPTSPNEECYTGILWDCNAGPRAGTYYHVLPSATESAKTEAGYNYVDYWSFYRYNQDQNDPLSIDDHQGDWEGVTVAPSLSNPSAFDFAIYAQHAGFSVYAPENLRCDETGEEESCGTEGTPAGHRPWDYVAVGTHAAYPGPDDGGLLGICTQAKSELPEGCHDGKAPWGANYEAVDALAFPPTGEGDWVDWPGRWGADEGKSPQSPGNQGRFKCPWKEVAEKDPTACPSRVVHNAVQARAATASACSNWFGAMVVLTACSPTGLRRAVQAASMGRRGSLRVRFGKHSRHAASLPGVAQAMGQPLRVGERVTIAGQAQGDTKLFVRGASGSHLVEAVFDGLGLSRGGRGVVSVLPGPGGPRLVWTAPDGRQVKPIAVHTGTLPRRASGAAGKTTQRTVSPGHNPKAAAAKARACKRGTPAFIRSMLVGRRLEKSDTSPAREHTPRHIARC
jgi:hypothetical protein